ncbi:MAG: hypothetical protein FJ280_07350 [Planctomycetes bacterium]|nr:hypothetical protein [Planctomycetota bacterium]
MIRRFVVQEHTTPEGVHWDLMLEKGDALVTFRLEQPPQVVLDHPVRATRIFDHSLRFLTYEGPVQQGTGKVRIVERGTCRLLAEADDIITMHLQGETLQGGFTLARPTGEKGTSYFLAHRQIPGDK